MKELGGGGGGRRHRAEKGKVGMGLEEGEGSLRGMGCQDYEFRLTPSRGSDNTFHKIGCTSVFPEWAWVAKCLSNLAVVGVRTS